MSQKFPTTSNGIASGFSSPLTLFLPCMSLQESNDRAVFEYGKHKPCALPAAMPTRSTRAYMSGPIPVVQRWLLTRALLCTRTYRTGRHIG